MNDEDIKILEEFIKEFKFDEINSTDKIDIIPAIENLLNKNKELEEIEQEHKKENGELRKRIAELEEENKTSKNITSQLMSDFINRNVIPVSKIKEIVDECIPRGKKIITGVEEYQPNANANSYFIKIYIKNDSTIVLPDFEKNTMYKCMETDKKYLLKELGLYD